MRPARTCRPTASPTAGNAPPGSRPAPFVLRSSRTTEYDFGVDERLRIEQWEDQRDSNSITVDLTLNRGYHRLQVEHYDAGGPAALRLSWPALPTPTPTNTATRRPTSTSTGTVTPPRRLSYLPLALKPLPTPTPTSTPTVTPTATPSPPPTATPTATPACSSGRGSRSRTTARPGHRAALRGRNYTGYPNDRRISSASRRARGAASSWT